MINFYKYNYLQAPRIVADYLNGQEEIGGLFASPGYSIAEIKKHDRLSTGDSSANFVEMRKKLVKTLQVYNRTLGCAGKTLTNLHKLEDPSCLAVVTGQQAALLTGASFVIYKAISAILLAKKLEEELAKPVVPVFWIASEDHDFLEINNCSFFTEEGKIKKYVITNSLPGLPPVGKIPVGKEIDQIISELTVFFHNNAVRELLADVLELAGTAASLTDFYGKIMTRFFQEYGLIFFDPMLSELRQLVFPLGEKVFNLYHEILEQINTGGEALKAKGYEPVFHTLEQRQFPMFYEINDQREPVYVLENKAIIGKNAPLTITFEKLAAKYRENPVKFSPNAFLRPIFQDYLLPTIAYVAGPGEINYLAQLKGLYNLFGVKMPVIFPRARLTLIGAGDYNFFNERKMEFPLYFSELNMHKTKYLMEKDKKNLFACIDTHFEQIFREYHRLKTLVEVNEPALSGLLKKNQGKISYQLDYLKAKVWQAYQKKHKRELQRFDRIYNLLHPRGKEQEMVINIFSFLELFGEDLIAKLMLPELIENSNEHKLVVMRSDIYGKS